VPLATTDDHNHCILLHMPTLRRILKYTPAVVLGLLVVAWSVGLFYSVLVPVEPTGRLSVETARSFVSATYKFDGGMAIGPFLSFRFLLWHYLAYRALVAVELAYYLRWQE